MAAAIEGTYKLDGMLQGKIPADCRGIMEPALKEWCQSATHSGFPFSLQIDGGSFSLLCGNEIQQIATDGISIADTLTESINALIESFPEEGKAQLFSTIRSSEYQKGTEIQGLYMIGSEGTIRSQTREIDAETVTPDTPLSSRDKLKLGLMAFGIIAVFALISSFFLPYKDWFGGARNRLSVLKVEDIAFDTRLYQDYVRVEPLALDRRKGGMQLKISRGPKWGEIGSTHLQLSEEGISWDRLLVLSNLKRGYIPCLIHTTEQGVISERKIPISSLLLLKESTALLTLPSRGRAERVELSR